MIVGAYRAGPDGNSEAGESYVVFGKADSNPVELASLETDQRGFRIDGIDAFDRSGFSVSGAGDVNGDGLDDVIVGAYGADPDGNSNAGESYVVFGKADSASSTSPPSVAAASKSTASMPVIDREPASPAPATSTATASTM